MSDREAVQIRQLVLSSLRRFQVDAHLADDVCQNILIRVLKIERTDGAFWTPGLIRRIAFQELISNVRASKRFQNRNNKRASITPEADLKEEPSRKLAQKQQASLVQNAIDAISALDATILRKRYYETKSYRQIAQAIGLTEGDVKVRCHRARKRLPLPDGVARS